MKKNKVLVHLPDGELQIQDFQPVADDLEIPDGRKLIPQFILLGPLGDKDRGILPNDNAINPYRPIIPPLFVQNLVGVKILGIWVPGTLWKWSILKGKSLGKSAKRAIFFAPAAG